jgi:hypothetical protein
MRDGQPYRTWHPQFDPVYWCAFGHEHGTNPAPIGGANAQHQPAYHLAAHHFTHHNGTMGEPHGQFKSVGYEWDGLHWYFTIHFGTSNAQRGACNRYHEVSVSVYHPNGTQYAELTWMGDFGATIRNTGEPTPLDLSGLGCPDQNAIQAVSAGNKLVPVGSSINDPALVMYYPWRIDTAGNVLGITGNFLLNTPDAMAICSDMSCSQNVVTGAKGTTYFFQAGSGFGIHSHLAGATGVFYTNATGTQIVAPGTPGAVRQYLAPGFSHNHTYVTDQGSVVSGAGFDDGMNNWYTVDTSNTLQGNIKEMQDSIMIGGTN